MTKVKRFALSLLVVGLMAVPANQALALTATTPSFAAFQDALLRIVVVLTTNATNNPEPPSPTESGQTMDPNG